MERKCHIKRQRKDGRKDSRRGQEGLKKVHSHPWQKNFREEGSNQHGENSNKPLF